MMLTTLAVASGQPSAERVPLPLLPAEVAWSVVLTSPPSADAAMDARRVYVAQQDDRISALDRETGRVVWTRPLASTWPLVVGEGRLYVVTDGELQALDAESGDLLWRSPLRLPPLAPLAFDAGWLLGMLEQGDVVAIRAADGQEIWRRRVGDGDRPLSAPVPGERDTFYLTLDDGTVAALSLTDGSVRWQQQLSGRLSPPAWAPGRVFVGSTDNHFYALDSSNGDVEWKWRAGGDVIGAVADDDLVYYASLDNIIRAVNRGNGNQRWRKDTGTRPLAPPDAVGHVAVLPGIDPTLTAFAARDGEAIGTYQAPGALQGPPLLDHAPKPFRVAIVLVLRNGQVIGLNPVGLLYREQPAAAVTALPGRVLQREPMPMPASGSPRSR
jgi:outer membrane protein assembly factor BamB